MADDNRSYSIAEFDLRAQLAEVRREITRRRFHYSRWIAEGRLSQRDADRQMVAMEAVAETLRNLIAQEEDHRQPKLRL